MDLHQRIRKLIYVPQLSGGRKTFLHFYWDGKAWSLREFRRSPTCRPGRATGRTCISRSRRSSRWRGRPELSALMRPSTRSRMSAFWYEKTVEANRKYLGIEPDAAASAGPRTRHRSSSTRASAPRPAGVEPKTYQGRAARGLLALSRGAVRRRRRPV